MDNFFIKEKYLGYYGNNILFNNNTFISDEKFYQLNDGRISEFYNHNKNIVELYESLKISDNLSDQINSSGSRSADIKNNIDVREMKIHKEVLCVNNSDNFFKDITHFHFFYNDILLIKEKNNKTHLFLYKSCSKDLEEIASLDEKVKLFSISPDDQKIILLMSNGDLILLNSSFYEIKTLNLENSCSNGICWTDDSEYFLILLDKMYLLNKNLDIVKINDFIGYSVCWRGEYNCFAVCSDDGIWFIDSFNGMKHGFKINTADDFSFKKYNHMTFSKSLDTLICIKQFESENVSKFSVDLYYTKNYVWYYKLNKIIEGMFIGFVDDCAIYVDSNFKVFLINFESVYAHKNSTFVFNDAKCLYLTNFKNEIVPLPYYENKYDFVENIRFFDIEGSFLWILTEKTLINIDIEKNNVKSTNINEIFDSNVDIIDVCAVNNELYIAYNKNEIRGINSGTNFHINQKILKVYKGYNRIFIRTENSLLDQKEEKICDVDIFDNLRIEENIEFLMVLKNKNFKVFNRKNPNKKTLDCDKGSEEDVKNIFDLYFEVHDIDSFCLYKNFICFTQNNKIVILNTKTNEHQIYILNENGAKIQTVVDSNIILFVPRGNFESFKPKIFIYDEIYKLLEFKEYFKAIQLCVSNCISFDVFLDYVIDFEIFFDNLSKCDSSIFVQFFSQIYLSLECKNKINEIKTDIDTKDEMHYLDKRITMDDISATVSTIYDGSVDRIDFTDNGQINEKNKISDDQPTDISILDIISENKTLDIDYKNTNYVKKRKGKMFRVKNTPQNTLTEIKYQEDFITNIFPLISSKYTTQKIKILSKINLVDQAVILVNNEKNPDLIRNMLVFIKEEEILKSALGLYLFDFCIEISKILNRNLYNDIIEKIKKDNLSGIYLRLFINKILDRKPKILFYMNGNGEDKNVLKDFVVQNKLYDLCDMMDNLNNEIMNDNDSHEYMKKHYPNFLNVNDIVVGCKSKCCKPELKENYRIPKKGFYNCIHAENLYKIDKKVESATVYLKAGDYIKSIDIYSELYLWEEACSIIKENIDKKLNDIKINETKAKIIDNNIKIGVDEKNSILIDPIYLYKKVIKKINEKNMHTEIGHIYSKYIKDFDNAYIHYMKGRAYKDAYDLNHKKFNSEIQEDINKQIIKIKNLMNELEKLKERFDNIMEKRKNNPSLVEYGSETSFTSSKNSRKTTKTKLRNKEGSRYEKEYVMDQVRIIYDDIGKIRDDIIGTDISSDEYKSARKIFVDELNIHKDGLVSLLETIFDISQDIFDPERPIIQIPSISDWFKN